MRRIVPLAIALVGLSVVAQGDAAARAIDFAAAELPTTGFVVLPVGKDGGLTGLATQVDATTQGAIIKAIGLAKFTGEAGQSMTLYDVGPYSAVLLVGTGAAAKSAVDLRVFGALAAKGSAGWSSVAQVVVPDASDVEFDAVEVAIGARLGTYDFGKWGAAALSSDETASSGLKLVTAQPAAAQAAFRRGGEAIVEGVTFARDLISTPSNVKTPEWFAGQVQQRFKGIANTKVTVLDDRQIKSLGMGALYGTGQGSARPPRLVAVEYRGAAADQAPIAFVGKGVTFDTGGISIKPGDGMWRMRTDMSGAAAVAGTILTLARRQAKVNAVAVMSLAENMPDGNAIRPGDVLTSMSGKTIEVLNTDAEGRLVLADALWWAQEQYSPRMAVTIATLTGAVVRALGSDHAGVFSQNDELAAQFIAAGEAAGERLWQLPVTPGTIKALRSDIADVKNTAEGSSAPGASFGAAFVMEWAKPEVPFAHIDIAGTAWESSGRPTEPKGAVGFGVRLFDELVRREESAKAR